MSSIKCAFKCGIKGHQNVQSPAADLGVCPWSLDILLAGLRLAVELGLPGSRHSLDLDRALALDLQPGAERPGSGGRNRSGRDSELLEQDRDQ